MNTITQLRKFILNFFDSILKPACLGNDASGIHVKSRNTTWPASGCHVPARDILVEVTWRFTSAPKVWRFFPTRQIIVIVLSAFS